MLRLYPLNLIRIMPAKGSVEIGFSVFGFPGNAFFVAEAYALGLEVGMKLMVNGETHEHKGNGSVDDLLSELGANKAHTALMINGEVVPSEKWAETQLKEDDAVEMLVFVGGG